MKNQLDNLNKLIDTIVPQKFYETRENYKKLLNKTINSPKEVIDEDTIFAGFYGIHNYSDKNFLTMVTLDMLSEGFISVHNSSFNNDYLWGKISSLLNNNDADNLRQTLTHELFENQNVTYTIKNVNSIFENTEFILFQLELDEFKAIGLTKKDNYNSLKLICSDLQIDLKETEE